MPTETDQNPNIANNEEQQQKLREGANKGKGQSDDAHKKGKEGTRKYDPGRELKENSHRLPKKLQEEIHGVTLQKPHTNWVLLRDPRKWQVHYSGPKVWKVPAPQQPRATQTMSPFGSHGPEKGEEVACFHSKNVLLPKLRHPELDHPTADRRENDVSSPEQTKC